MVFHLRKKSNVQKVTKTTKTMTATGTLTTVTATATASMTETTTETTSTGTRTQAPMKLKSKFKGWWQSTYPAKCKQNRSEKLGQSLALEILRRARSDDAQRRSSGSSGSSGGSGSGIIVATLRVSP